MTDRKGRHARGWLFYDAECGFCTRIARLLAGPLQKRALAIAPLQDPRVGTLLGLSRDELLRAIRLVLSDGHQHAGAEVFVALARELWWLRPLLWIWNVPGGSFALHSAYHWVAGRRQCRTRALLPSLTAKTNVGGCQ
jgi:predicted DCC family thiol-disulfide oxidoreductase YuxK